MRRSRGLIVVTLAIVVIGLSIGFAAFSNTLSIKSNALVNPDSSNFSVVFSTNASTLQTNPVNPNSATYGDPGTINNREGNPRLTGLHAKFTEPGDSVTYSLYVLNNGKYDAYLTNLNFDPQTGNSFIKCISGVGTTDALTQAACADMYVTVQVGNETFYSNAQAGLSNTLNNHLLLKGSSEQVIVTITYADNNHYVDGPASILLGDIQLQYRTVNSPTQTVTPKATPTNSSCFVSVIPGQINDYLCNDTDLVIEDNLQLGTRSASSISFNSQKCAAFETDLVGINEDYTCSNLQAQFNQLKSNPQALYSTFLGAFAIVTYGDESTTKNTITTLGAGTFAGRGLTNVELGEGITTISDYAFLGNSINNLELSSTLTIIGEAAFMYNSIPTIDLKNVQTIGATSFSQNQIAYLDIPNSVTSVGKWAFTSNNIRTLSLGSGLTSTGDGAYQMNGLTSIDFSRATNLTTIDRGAFWHNELTSVTIPNTITTIGNNAFTSNRLTSITIPNSVTSIGTQAFVHNQLRSVTLGTGITSIGASAFGLGTDSFQGITWEENAITNVTINASKSNVGGIAEGTFGYDYNSNCRNTTEGDWKSNTCITWVNG